MHSRSRVAFLFLPALAICAGLAFGLGGRAATAKADADKKAKAAAAKKQKPAFDKMMTAIGRNAKLPGGANYWSNVQAIHPGQKRMIVATQLSKMPAGGAKPLTTAFAPNAGKKSSLTLVGEDGLPPGFGKGFTWDRVEDVQLVMFINASDPTGISIEGVQSGDYAQVVSAVGTASFSESSFKYIANSVVALAGVAGTSLAPEAKDAIATTEKTLIEQFNAMDVKKKCRDAFGEDPASGAKACQEGGVLVCMPEAGGIYYSGNHDHKERWIKQPGNRTDEHLPAHVKGAFFPIRGDTAHNTRMAKQTGPMFVTAWDHAYGDNAGYYKVFVTLKKGTGPYVPPDWPNGPVGKKVPTPKAKPKQ